ncbi:DnaB-like helicase N-terminal domain-containing protein [Kitasatospora sp. NPDC017646]|uniref:DnaB-like helicase N-terminal domain-containing protein n=1 Tax=Kitasatospora sp. NPDC017646 TaxID=3364024 RepID=UPI003788D7EB
MSATSRDLSPQLHAEQATLGSCLLDPRQLALLGPWLEPRHFYRPAHVAFFALLLDHQAAGQRATTEDARRDWALEVIGVARRTIPGFAASYGHTLVAACPSSANAAAYGRMVLETAVRRSLEEHAHRLLAAAESGSVQDTVELTGTLHAVIERLAAAWGPIETRSRHPLPQAAPSCDGRAAQAARDHERMLLSTLIGAAGQVGPVASWLTEADFVDDGHRVVFQAMAALDHRGEPVDELTVLWEVQRRGALAEGTIGVAQVRDLLDPVPGDPAYWAEQVLHCSLLRASATSAGIVRVMALDASVGAGRLLGASLRALEPADRLRERHRAATGTSGPTRSGRLILGTRRQDAATRSSTSADRPNHPAAEPARPRR